MPLRSSDEAFLPQLQRYRNAGVNVVMLNVGFGDQPIELSMRMLAHFRRWLSIRPQDYVLIKTVCDVDHAQETGRLGIGFDIEGMDALGGQLSLIQLYYDLGVRWMLLAYNINNCAGGGCHDDDGGLTDFGRAAIDEMARVGMVLCCSHTGPKTAREAIAHSSNPVIFSHSNPAAVYDHPRSLSDDLIRLCAEGGGVIGITGPSVLMGGDDNSTDRFIRHIDHVVQLVGPAHVGIGLDYMFDMTEVEDYLAKMKGKFPPGMGYASEIKMVEPERLTEIVLALLRRGYSDGDVAGILGGNWRRVAEQVWR
jgi:membrane dipeptidase